jgi:hypothetical protein
MNSLEKNNEKEKNEQLFISEIKKIKEKILNVDLFKDFDNQIFSLFQKQKNKIKKNEWKKQILKQKQKINLEYKQNIQDIKNQFQILEQKKNDNLIPQKKLIKTNNKEQNKKKTIHLEFKNSIQRIEEETNTYLKKIINLEKILINEKKSKKKKLLEEQIKISDQISEKKNSINNFFYEKYILLNEKIKNTKLKYNNEIKNIDKINENKINQIKEEKNKKKIFLNIKIEEINKLLKNKLNIHNKILIQEQKKFSQNKKKIEIEKKKLFLENKLIMFFILKQINPQNYKFFLNLLKKTWKNNYLYQKKIYLWEKKYIFIKLIFKKKINILFLENKYYDKKQKIKIENNLFAKEKEKEIIQKKLLKCLNCLELEIRIAEIEKKYNLKEIMSSEEIKKNEVNFIFFQKNIIDKLKIENINFQKKNIQILNEQKKKQSLLQMQIKIEKINLKSYYFDNISETNKKIKEIENRLTYLKNNKTYEIQKKSTIFEQQKQDFAKRTKLKKNQFEYIIRENLENNENFFHILILFNEYIKNKEEEIKKLFQKIKEKLKTFFIMFITERKKKSYILKFSYIHELLEFFIDEIKDKHFYCYYLWKKKIYNFQKSNLKTKKNLNQNLTKYYKQNIFFIQNLIKKKKLNKSEENIFDSLENKIKNYENFYITLKKENSKLNLEKIKKDSEFERKINNFKKKQNKKIQKNNFYQQKIFLYLEKIKKLSNSKIIGKKILLWFYNKKIFNYWDCCLKNIDSFEDFLYKEQKKFSLIIEKKLRKKQKNKKKFYKYEKQLVWISNKFHDIIKEIYLIKIQNLSNKTNEEENQLNQQIFALKKIIKNQFQEMKEKMSLLQLNLKEAKTENDIFVNNQIKKIQNEQNQIKKFLIEKLNQKKDIYKKTIFLESKKTKIMKISKKTEKKIIFSHFYNMEKKYSRHCSKIEKKINKNNKKTNWKIILLSTENKIYSYILKIFSWIQFCKKKSELKKNTQKKIKKNKNKIKINNFFYKKIYDFFK